jgi:hypothetical protein
MSAGDPSSAGVSSIDLTAIISLLDIVAEAEKRDIQVRLHHSLSDFNLNQLAKQQLPTDGRPSCSIITLTKHDVAMTLTHLCVFSENGSCTSRTCASSSSRT